MTIHVSITRQYGSAATPRCLTPDQRRNLDCAYRDGLESAACGETAPDFWELVDLGYTPMEALYFLHAHGIVGS